MQTEKLTLVDRSKSMMEFSFLKIKGIFGSKLARYIVVRTLYAIFTFFASLTIVFYLYHVLPGSAANVFAQDPRLPEETRNQIYEDWGLNEP
ncbi:MAG: hypothetical protein ACW99Q_13565, partial [Candidatus Kariarchaeaceae archaeon]